MQSLGEIVVLFLKKLTIEFLYETASIPRYIPKELNPRTETGTRMGMLIVALLTKDKI